MDEPIEEVYFNWLYTKVLRTQGRTPSTSYRSLIFGLHSIPFQWLVTGDDNRVADGIDLRYVFLHELRIDAAEEQEWLELDCSVLEMFVALADRCAFQTALSSKDWIWLFLENLGLDHISERSYEESSADIYPTVIAFINREYYRNGRGGIFPLSHGSRDQRRVELWYQFSEYLVDKDIP